MLNKKFILALAILIGTIVGAGIFAIPYVIARSGIIPGFFYFLILGSAILLLHLFFGEIVLRTNDRCGLSGYSEKYLGKWGKRLVTLSTILGISGTLLAYIILGGDFLKIIFFPFVNNLPSSFFSIFFWAILVYFVFKGKKIVAPVEVFTNSAFFIIIFIVLLFLLPKLNFQNFALINPEHLFLPYGVIMFSLVGFVAIPEMADILRTPEERKLFKKIIIIASAVVIILYLIFSLAVVGVSGSKTSNDALSGLIPFLGQKVIVLGALFGAITLADSFLIICIYFKNTLIYDYHFPKTLASLVSSGIPLILFLMNLKNFIQIIGFVGTVLGTIEGIIIVLIFRKIKKLGDRMPEYNLNIPSFLPYLLIIIFISGAILQIFYSLK